MRHFLIITNTYKDENGRLTGELASYIRKKGGECDCFYSDGESKSEAAPALEQMDPATDCVMVLGGDGTLIRAASRLVDSRIPLIGVNLGTVGYLCELEESNVFDAVDRLMADDCMVEERMMLTGAGILGGVREEYGVALNDIVIHRTGELSVVSLIVYVNGEYLHTFRADGIIVSTPTGSTGYNMSAGGPIVDPKAQMILITPINAHNLNSRSIVIGAEDEVVVEIGRRRSQKDETLEVSFDGDTAARLVVGDKFSIRKASDTTRILKLSNKSFLEILSKKMQVYT
ncbi:MAG: NAD(+)/NADH kinase [Roseburia hominis]|uniref:NAD(+)/NADH kinase n=1 Tax=Roseburia hominis TaxID=301301 RepID=UPI0026ED7BD5|nr:NAD(+)/NADH kinase [Roseburia hominis]MCI7523374.1 NAD(+)/NADH kinase [Roseburia hominis]MDD6241849.1 NAD(+)/NADH kinase [Roseburia hominis]